MSSGAEPPSRGRQRLDKWLFYSRAVKSRTLAQKLVESGVVRVNSDRTVSPDRRVGAGDVLTMTIGQRLLVWRILDEGERRGPATEAATLYEDLSPAVLPKAKVEKPSISRDAGSGRPTKKDRRDTDRWRRDDG